jgi:hypothetical protein
MGSGMFPLSPIRDDYGVKLKNAADAIEDVCNAISEDIYSGDAGGGQFDNAASDGGDLALLRLAVKLIRDRLKI